VAIKAARASTSSTGESIAAPRALLAKKRATVETMAVLKSIFVEG
jgi:hypothetical protein